MRKFFVLASMLLSMVSGAHAELMLPSSGDKLGVGGHLKMHRAVAVDAAAPDSALQVTATGETRVKSVRINHELLTATPINLNRMSAAVGVASGAAPNSVFIGAGGAVSVPGYLSFGDGKICGAPLRIVPGGSEPILVRNNTDTQTLLKLTPATNQETVIGAVTDKPVTPAGVNAALASFSATAFDGSLGAFGRQRFSSGLTLQWGTVTVPGDSSVLVPFSPAFSEAVYVVLFSPIKNLMGSSSDGELTRGGLTTSGVYLNNGKNVSLDIAWMALGK